MAILEESSKVKSTGNKEGKLLKLLNDKSVVDVISDEVEGFLAESMVLIVESGASVSAGVVVLEGAPSSGYTGTWKELVSLTINAATKIFSGGIGVIDELPMPYVRARIKTVITGGTVDVFLAVRK